MRIFTCWKCGQIMTDDSCADERHLMIECRGVCEPCLAKDRKPQGESLRLFTPTPGQISGQLNF